MWEAYSMRLPQRVLKEPKVETTVLCYIGARIVGEIEGTMGGAGKDVTVCAPNLCCGMPPPTP